MHPKSLRYQQNSYRKTTDDIKCIQHLSDKKRAKFKNICDKKVKFKTILSPVIKIFLLMFLLETVLRDNIYTTEDEE